MWRTDRLEQDGPNTAADLSQRWVMRSFAADDQPSVQISAKEVKLDFQKPVSVQKKQTFLPAAKKALKHCKSSRSHDITALLVEVLIFSSDANFCRSIKISTRGTDFSKSNNSRVLLLNFSTKKKQEKFRLVFISLLQTGGPFFISSSICTVLTPPPYSMEAGNVNSCHSL